MSQNFLTAHAAVCALVEKFEKGAATFLEADYKEATARLDFLDPLFIALGWDVRRERSPDPLQQEVKIELSQTMADSTRSADYAFSLAPHFGKTRFFCEAKKPSRKLRNADDCFQAIRYGWNAGNPLVVLSDFEELFVLDCRAIPDRSTAIARILQSWKYTDFRDETKFRALYNLLNRDAVAAGSLEKFVADLKEEKGIRRQHRLFGAAYQAVDVAFLNQLEEWRLALARSFARTRPALDAEDLTEATQRALDRLVFVRFLEDKLIETTARVDTWTGTDAWLQFQSAARELDKTYNGVLWKKHFLTQVATYAMKRSKA